MEHFNVTNGDLIPVKFMNDLTKKLRKGNNMKKTTFVPNDESDEEIDGDIKKEFEKLNQKKKKKKVKKRMKIMMMKFLKRNSRYILNYMNMTIKSIY